MNGATTMNQDFESPRVEPVPAEPPVRSYGRVDPRERFVDDPRRKSALTAAILSAMPGLGQIYVGYYQQGFVHALTVAGLIAIIVSGVIGDLVGIVGFLLAFFWLYNVIDAARRASLYNQALSGLRPMDLPEDVGAPRSVGSFAGGLALIAAGVVLFGHTMFGMSLAWVAQWWPIGLVGLGAWLVYEDRRMKRARASGG